MCIPPERNNLMMLIDTIYRILGQNPPGQNPPDKTPRTIPRWTKPPDGQNPPVDKTPLDKTPPDKTPRTKPPPGKKTPGQNPPGQNPPDKPPPPGQITVDLDPQLIWTPSSLKRKVGSARGCGYAAPSCRPHLSL